MGEPGALPGGGPRAQPPPGKGRGVEVYKESCQERAGSRGRVEKWFSCESGTTAVTAEAEEVGKLGPTLQWSRGS